MVLCAIFGCSHRTERTNEYSYYRIPAVKRNVSLELKILLAKRRNLWIRRINRKDFNLTKASYARVCSDHFISGAPSVLRDTANPDWAPSLNLGHDYFKGEDKEERSPKTSERVTVDYTSLMEENDDVEQLEDKDSSTDESEGMSEESSISKGNNDRQDRLKYFIFGSSKPNIPSQTCSVTHKEALTSAETLYRYMENQEDVDHADLILIRGYMRKIKENMMKEG